MPTCSDRYKDNPTGSCYIFGASEAPAIRAGSYPRLNGHFTPNKDSDIIIAADAGYLHAEAFRLVPDIIIGDFDSIPDIPECGAELIKFPKEKDDTDLMLAVKCGMERGFKSFVIYGAMGGRVDFTLANFQILTYMARIGLDAYFIGKGSVMTAIKSGRVSFSDDFTGRISVLCASEVAAGVTISGLKYTLDSGRLTGDFPLGISNEFVKCPSYIEVKDGILTVIYDSINGPAEKEYF